MPTEGTSTMTITATRTADATWYPLPGQRSIGAHWNVETRRWDVLHLGHGVESSWGSYAEDARQAAELAAEAAYGLLLWVVA
jgi:hypothetical protein